MSLPKASVKSRGEQDLKWMSTAPEDIRDPKFLWGYHERFNIIQMPIVGAEEFVAKAIEVAKDSSDGKDFEKRLGRIISQQKAEVTEWYTDFRQNAWKEGQSFPCGAARIIAVDFCKTGSLKNVLQILHGVAHGWEAEECIIDGAPIEPLSDDGSDIPLTQFWKDEDLCNSDMAPSDTSDFLNATDRDMSEAPSEASTTESFISRHQKPLSSSMTTEEHVRHLPGQNVNRRWGKHTKNKNLPKKRARFDDAAGADDAVQPDNESDDDNLFSSHQPIASTQRVSGYPAKKRRRLVEDDTRETESPMTSDQVASDRRIEKKAGAYDDYNDGRGHERQRPRRWTSTISDFTTSVIISENAPTDNGQENPSSASEKNIVGNISRKRSQTDDDDNGNEEHRHKHRRIETPESTPMLHIPPLTQQLTDDSMTMTNPKVDDEVKGSQPKRRKRTTSSPGSLRARLLSSASTLNARSTRRAEPSTFWELDDAGNPCSI